MTESRRIVTFAMIALCVLAWSAGPWLTPGFAQVASSVTDRVAGAPGDGLPADAPAAPDPPAPPIPSPSPPAPAPAGTVPGEEPAASHALYVPDGQLVSHNIRVYLSGPPITLDQAPRLKLLRSHAVTARAVNEATAYAPSVVAPGQTWQQPRQDGVDVVQAVQGTLLMFDVSALDFGGKAMLRVTPVLTWKGRDGRPVVSVSEREVNLGNVVATSLWTLLIVVLTVIAIIRLAKEAPYGWKAFLVSGKGHLSLSMVQVACWTIAVGTIVLGYGLVRLDIPEIPESLLVLMGASLATGGVGYFKGDQIERERSPDSAAVSPQWTHLIVSFSDSGKAEASLAKAQMVFWTAILIVLFVSKSVLDGRIWDVPWPLVALMGFSQAGYLAPKFALPGSTPGSTATGGANATPAGGTAASSGATAAPAGGTPTAGTAVAGGTPSETTNGVVE